MRKLEGAEGRVGKGEGWRGGMISNKAETRLVIILSREFFVSSAALEGRLEPILSLFKHKLLLTLAQNVRNKVIPPPVVLCPYLPTMQLPPAETA